jgi:hypothetical protein
MPGPGGDRPEMVIGRQSKQATPKVKSRHIIGIARRQAGDAGMNSPDCKRTAGLLEVSAKLLTQRHFTDSYMGEMVAINIP